MNNLQNLFDPCFGHPTAKEIGHRTHKNRAWFFEYFHIFQPVRVIGWEKWIICICVVVERESISNVLGITVWTIMQATCYRIPGIALRSIRVVYPGYFGFVYDSLSSNLAKTVLNSIMKDFPFVASQIYFVVNTRKKSGFAVYYRHTAKKLL